MKPKLNLEALVVLDVIARRSSFAAAAEELHRVPSSITYTIKRLEENLGVTLFNRQGHRAQLTSAGQALLNEGRSLLLMSEGIERNIQQIATGWETELRIAVDDIIPYEKVLSLCDKFYQFSPSTRLYLTSEVLGGTWDALVSGRADLVIGVTGDGPPGGGFTRQILGEVEFVFVVAPNHPLAKEKEPLTNNLIRQYRAIAAADSSRQLLPKTVRLLVGQTVLTVPNLRIKRQAQISGLGIGYLPKHMVSSDISEGRLIVKETEDEGNSLHSLYCVWPTHHQGKALAWFKEHLSKEAENINWFSK
ncbi:MAG: LysR family transcriptional regulator [Piscirickettsiaceae bacterium]|nr:LysR family transcriptional regulator [Piscirickettsiaceae bacterium]